MLVLKFVTVVILLVISVVLFMLFVPTVVLSSFLPLCFLMMLHRCMARTRQIA